MPTTLREFQRLWRARRLLFLAAGARLDALPKAEEEALCAQALALLGLTSNVPPWFLSVAFEMVRSPHFAFRGVYDPPETRAVHAAARAFVASLALGEARRSTSPLPSASPLAHAVRRSELLSASPSASPLASGARTASFRQRLDEYVVCLEAWCLAEAFPNALLRTARTLRFAATWWAQRHTTYRY